MIDNFHKLLQKQLKKLNLKKDIPPTDCVQWNLFLSHINNTYLEADQERYLNERSIEISSRELLNLNKKLENAQHIAKLGYWSYSLNTKKFLLSKELYNLFHIETDKKLTSFKDFIKDIHPEDRKNITSLVNDVLKSKKSFSCDIRRFYKNDSFDWFHIIGFAITKNDNSYSQVSGIIMNITDRKIAEEKIIHLHEQLVDGARKAGMAEIATSILHNVGNVLNSANVSLNLIKENLDNLAINQLFKAFVLLETHEEDINSYLYFDTRGKLLPRYFLTIFPILKEEIKKLKKEVDSLFENINYIREAVLMQQNYIGTSGIYEKVFIPEIVDIALKMSGYYTFPKNIQVKKNYKITPFLITDKSKILQILVNLIKNAKEAVLSSSHKIDKAINLIIEKDNKNKEFKIIVEDNGIGIEKGNLKKIFSSGFTSKLKGFGHGIGLHTSALLAKDIGGRIEVESLGPELGSVFSLSLPIKNNDQRSAYESK